MPNRLLLDIEVYLRRTGCPAATFGSRALKNPCFVNDLRSGSVPKRETARRVREWMESNPTYQSAKARRAAARPRKEVPSPPPTPSLQALVELYPHAAIDINIHARQRGFRLQDYLAKLVLIGWDLERRGRTAA